MSARIEGKVLALFVLMLLAVASRELLRSGPGSDSSRAGSDAALFPDFQGDSVTRLQVRVEGRSDRLERNDDGSWVVVEGADLGRAHPESVAALLQALAELPEGREVADDPKLAQRFGISERTGVEILAFAKDGRLEAAVAFGSMDARGSFVRLSGESVIRKVSGDLSSVFRPRRVERFGWRDDSILSVGSADEVQELHLDGPDGRISLVRDADSGGMGWRMTAPREAVAVDWKCKRMAEDLSRLLADRPYAGSLDAGQLGLSPPSVTATAVRSDGSETVLLIGSLDLDGNAPVMLPGGSTIWLIPKFRADEFRSVASALVSH